MTIERCRSAPRPYACHTRSKTSFQFSVQGDTWSSPQPPAELQNAVHSAVFIQASEIRVGNSIVTQRFPQSMRRYLLQSPRNFALECHPNPVRLTCDQLIYGRDNTDTHDKSDPTNASITQRHLLPCSVVMSSCLRYATLAFSGQNHLLCYSVRRIISDRGGSHS